jgi:hypothetical protein
MKIITFRDFPEDPEVSKLPRIEISDVPPGAMMVRQMVFPGMFGAPDLHITHIVPPFVSRIICYTGKALTPEDRTRITAECCEFWNSQNKE